jgi:hypothetical protein
MLFLSIVHHYLLWHYSRAFLEILHVWKNLLWFVIRFFSIPQLMSSWFAPWKRMTEKRRKKWDFEDLAGFVIIGFISRVIGFILRTVVIFIGMICLVLTVIGGLLVFAFWIAAPLILIMLLGFGITLLIAS